MNTTKLAVGLLLATSSLVCIAAGPYADTTREQRMDDALQNYRSTHPDPTTGQPSTARSESGLKGGVRRTGAAIERGAEKGGNAVKHGLEKVGEAAHRVGDKISEKVNGNKTP